MNNEVKKIKTIARNSRYDTRTADEILKKQKQQKYRTKNEQGKNLGTVLYIEMRTNKFIKVLKQCIIKTGIKKTYHY